MDNCFRTRTEPDKPSPSLQLRKQKGRLRWWWPLCLLQQMPKLLWRLWQKAQKICRPTTFLWGLENSFFFRFYKPIFRTMILQWFLTPALTGPSTVPIRRFFRNLFPSLSKMSKLFQEQSESGKKTGTKYGWGGWGWGTERCEDCPPVSGNSLIFSAFKSFTWNWKKF